ncbi:ureidoglycolate lyase [Bordetella bronchiseptica]|uniref:Ureidoglycolate hydrolase n=2 Tax=Alcaligenaceae TaxID=506 RepID=A0ABX4F922_9BORD|nr:ureidoglycolate hydrolase [Bordetella bronchiseptica]AZW42589.1 ureidoglycolate lyase [Bordetella bronchiseptica]KCV64366.1 ureidoglycolate lyase [Bordetella bronchiseptica 99-R-0433]MBN3268008.1 ureidoglycolate lyase [Bordetella bronchiseptica]OZI69971.1 ureidoglycolate hydrolase [Bordetella genomosp. 6]
MSSMYLSASTLSADAFSQYGEVVENRGDTAKRPLSTPFGSARPGVTLGFTVNRLHRQPLDGIRVRTLERHPHSAQTFIPLVPSRHVIVVGLSGPDGALALPTLRAFVTNGRQGVSYRTGVWHYAFTAIDTDSQVAVILGKTGRDDDTEYTELDQDALVVFNEE